MATALTDKNGIAKINAPVGDTVSVSKTGYTFNPTSITISNNQSAITFTGTPTSVNPIGALTDNSYMWIALAILIVLLIFGIER
ncbi:MAG: hypothetical protein ACP5L4_06650 [Thermoplasmata archaeon]